MLKTEEGYSNYENRITHIVYQPLTPQKEFELEIGITDNAEILIQQILHFFPEISKDSVVLKYKSIRTSMACKPVLKEIFNKKRKYEIIINNDPKDVEIPFDKIPFQAKIGIIAHELGHVLDYQNKSLFQLIKTGLLYIIRNQEKYEKSIDYLTIKKGFGWQVLAWSDYAFNHSNASASYLEFKDTYYFNPKEIEAILKSDKRYKTGLAKEDR